MFSNCGSGLVADGLLVQTAPSEGEGATVNVSEALERMEKLVKSG